MLVSQPPVKASVDERPRPMSFREDIFSVGLMHLSGVFQATVSTVSLCSCSTPAVFVFLSHPICESEAVSQKTPHGLVATAVT